LPQTFHQLTEPLCCRVRECYHTGRQASLTLMEALSTRLGWIFESL